MTPEACLLAWLVPGLLVALVNDRYVVRENLPDQAERSIYFVRAAMAWPTYLAEDFLRRYRGDDDATC